MKIWCARAGCKNEILPTTLPSRPQSYCPSCRTKINKEGYKRTKQKRKLKANARVEENKNFIRTLKTTTACADCENFFPFYVMDYHHVDPKIKHKAISQLMGVTRQTLKNELDKCILLCANCHRIRTHEHKYDEID